MKEMTKENKICKECLKEKEDVRFESETESFICDNCLIELKGGLK